MDNSQAVLSLVEQEGEEVAACMKAKFDLIFLLLTGGKLSACELGTCKNAIAKEWIVCTQ